MKTIAEQLEESHIDDFGKCTVPFTELQKAGGVIVDSSSWAPYYTVKNWNRWQFPDGSTYFQYFVQRVS